MKIVPLTGTLIGNQHPLDLGPPVKISDLKSNLQELITELENGLFQVRPYKRPTPFGSYDFSSFYKIVFCYWYGSQSAGSW